MRARGVEVPEPGRRPLLVSKGWVQAVALVVLFGFFVLGFLTYRTYQAKPPIPQRVVDPAGQVLYTADDIAEGQQVFLHNGLMEYGSVLGHGAYLGPDFTADYLRRSSDFVLRSYGGARSDSAARRTAEDFRTNRYDERSGTLRLTAPQAEAHRRLVGTTRASSPSRRPSTGCAARRSPTGPSWRSSPPSSAGRPGSAPRTGPATTTPTRTTGRPSRAYRTSRPRTWSSGRCCR